MSDENKSALEALFLRVMDNVSAKLANDTERVVSPETMAAALTEFIAAPEFWNLLWTVLDKKEFAEAITPYVRGWYEGRLEM
jgi:hypothetical protein